MAQSIRNSEAQPAWTPENTIPSTLPEVAPESLLVPTGPGGRLAGRRGPTPPDDRTPITAYMLAVGPLIDMPAFP